MHDEDEERLLRSVALQTARGVLLARQRAEEELVRAKEALERKTTELDHTVAMLRATLESTTDGILVTDAAGRVTNYNDKFVRMWRVPREVLDSGDRDRALGVAARQFADPDRFLAAVAAIDAASPPESDDLLELADGRVIERFSGIQHVDGWPAGRVWSFRDITGRRRAERALRESEARNAAIVRTALDGVIAIDHEGKVVEFNPAAERITGYRREDVLGREMADLIIPAPRRESHRLGMARYLAAGEGRVLNRQLELTALRADGTEFPVELAITRINEDGPPLFTGYLRDITARKELEGRLRQSQKMEAVGQLAGGVAHDFNNLLTVICGYTELLLPKFPPADPDRELLAAVLHAGDRAAALTRQLLAFSRKQVLEPRVLDLNEVVRGFERMVRRLIGEDVRLAVALDPGAGRVRVDPGQLEQVLINFVVNARDAMPQGGGLTIETRDAELDEEYCRGRDGCRPGRYVLLAVTDTGCGMTPEVRSRVFEPFFTTKEVGKGTGLGLATVYGIVKQSDGHVAVYSEPGLGTTFKVYLPRVELPPAKSSPGAAVLPRGDETLLLVEDEDAVRRLAERVLRSCGYAVLAAADGEEAVRLAGGHPGPVHLLVSDVVMPRVSGRAVAERVAGVKPGVKVLFMSGYTDDAVIRHGVVRADTPFLHKPFTTAQLAQKVREVLDRAG